MRSGGQAEEAGFSAWCLWAEFRASMISGGEKNDPALRTNFWLKFSISLHYEPMEITATFM